MYMYLDTCSYPDARTTAGILASGLGVAAILDVKT